MKVYIVTVGSYSDYSIQAVYDNEAEAMRHADCLYGANYEEWELNHKYPVPVGKRPYFVTHNNHGHNEWLAFVQDGPEEGKAYISGWNGGVRGDSRYFTFSTHCFARDEQHALKIASERKAFMIAAYGSNVECSHNFGSNVPEAINAQ